jgi:drug/metabolite transporter (DMT)-like permease
MIEVVMLNAFMASTFIIGKLIATYTKPLFFIGSSMTLGGTLLLAYQYFKDPAKLKIKKNDVHWFIQVAYAMVCISYLLQLWGMQYLPSFKTCFLYNVGPFSAYLIAYFIFGQKMNWKKWVGLTIGFLGLLPIIISSSPAEESLKALVYISLPEIAVMVSAAAYAYGWFVVKILVHERHYSPITVNGVYMLIGGITTLALVPSVEGSVTIKNPLAFILLAASVIIIEYVIVNNWYARLLNKYSETFLSFANFSIPLFGGVYGSFILNETITWHFFASTIIVAIAMWFFYRAEMEENPTHKPEDFEL